MDYCSSCRRHLNGALVCPGCGAYAPDIAPVTTHDRVVPARAAQPMYTTTYAEPTPWTEPSRGPAPAASHREPPHASLSATSAPSFAPSSDRPGDRSPLASSGTGDVPSVEPAPAAPRGRAARRRQLARWKKHQRRAVVATAVALVGGGLTVAALDRQGGDRTQAAAAPELPATSGGEEPASDHTRPTVTRSDAHRPDPSTVASQSPATELGGERYTPSGSRPETAASGSRTRTTSRSAPGRGTGSSYGAAVTAPGGSAGQQSSTSSGTSGSSGSTANGGTGASDPSSTSNSSSGSGSQTTTGSSGSGPASGSGTSSSSTNPAPAATSPSDVCLLGLLCLS
ncbi:SCO2400 family protein [Streptomyces sp. NPDC001500]